MEAVIGLLLMLLRVTRGLESDCDGRQDRAQCYGALGGTVNLQLLNRASDVFDFHWKKNKSVILRVREGRIADNLIDSRSSFTSSNGTFRIINLSRTDEGEYFSIGFNKDGDPLLLRTLQLTIEAPVSSVSLVSECLSQGMTRASCSSEGGDSPQYSWTLDGRPLRNDQLLSLNTESENITLRGDGELVCTVRNHVSSVERSEEISTCGFTFTSCTLSNGTYISLWLPEANKILCIEPTTTSTDDPSLLICSVRTAVVILLLAGIAVYFTWKKKKSKMAEGSVIPEKTEGQENSVVTLEMRNCEYEN
ncbi:uncharacterized protein V6R79_026385 [Siganus canaliculatus]